MLKPASETNVLLEKIITSDSCPPAMCPLTSSSVTLSSATCARRSTIIGRWIDADALNANVYHQTQILDTAANLVQMALVFQLLRAVCDTTVSGRRKRLNWCG